MDSCRDTQRLVCATGRSGRWLLSLLLLLSAVSASASDWEGVYGVESVERARIEQDFSALSSRGVNLVVQNVLLQENTGDPLHPGWRGHYEAAVRHGIRLIPILWDGSKGQTVFAWNAARGEFELDIDRYPNSPAARFLQFLRDNPTFLSHTFALFSFHEPFNDENGAAQRTVAQNRKLWQQIHQEEFPNGDLKVYGESITHVNGCENGCVDYAANSLFSFSYCSGAPRYSALTLVPSAATGINIWYDRCITNKDVAVQRGIEQIDFFRKHSHDAPPAPDGTYTKFLILIQSYVENPAATVYSRMPSASEMREWVERIILARKDSVVGVAWYSWDRIASHYQKWLAQDRFDDTGADRWEAVRQAGEMVRGVSVPPPPPGPTPTPTPTPPTTPAAPILLP